MIPPKLKAGHQVRVIAPSQNHSSDFTYEMKANAIERLERMGLTVTFGKYAEAYEGKDTCSLEERLSDLHDAFADPTVHAIIPLAGDASVVELLKFIDYTLIKNNPKTLFGLSATSELSFALLAKTGLVSYYGPHFSMLGTGKLEDYSYSAMKEILMVDATIRLYPSKNYHYIYEDDLAGPKEGIWSISEGKAEGTCLGGNFLTINYLLESEFMPELNNSILFIEENHFIDLPDVQKELEHILTDPGSDHIRGLMIGRFKEEAGITREWLTSIIKSNSKLEDVPVIANIDFGNTSSRLTLPIGGTLRLDVKGDDKIKIDVIRN